MQSFETELWSVTGVQEIRDFTNCFRTSWPVRNGTLHRFEDKLNITAGLNKLVRFGVGVNRNFIFVTVPYKCCRVCVSSANEICVPTLSKSIEHQQC